MLYNFTRRLSFLEWLIVTAIIVVLAAILLPPRQGVADGDFHLRLSFTGSTTPMHQLRVAVGYGDDPDKYWKSDMQQNLIWHEPDAWDGPMPPIRCSYSYKLKTDWLGRMLVPAVYPRLLIAEYTAPNEAPSYRVIVFERRHGQELVELTIPREPPSDAEAWKPPEGTGR